MRTRQDDATFLLPWVVGQERDNLTKVTRADRPNRDPHDDIRFSTRRDAEFFNGFESAIGLPFQCAAGTRGLNFFDRQLLPTEVQQFKAMHDQFIRRPIPQIDHGGIFDGRWTPSFNGPRRVEGADPPEIAANFGILFGARA